MPRYQITHTTAYHYDEAVSLAYNEGRLLPRTVISPLFRQECYAAQLSVDPPWNDARERTDFFGNRVSYFTLRQPHQKVVITATSEVQVTPMLAACPNGETDIHHLLASLRTAQSALSWEAAVAALSVSTEATMIDARQFVLPSAYTGQFPALQEFARASFPANRPLLLAAADLMTRIFQEFEFVSGVTTIATPLAEVLAERKGVCQDFAHLMLAALRAQGLAARYMSGYIETLPPPGQEKLAGSDASHAWCSLFVPDLGWVDFDPTNNLIPQEQHVVLGWGRDFGDVTPLKGVFFGDGRHDLTVAVDMVRVEAEK